MMLRGWRANRRPVTTRHRLTYS